MTNPDLERLLIVIRHLHDASTHDYLYEKLIAEQEQLKGKIDEALIHVEACQAFVLTGEDARKFEEYNNRTPTKEELEFMKEADRIYAIHDKDKQDAKIVDEIRNKIIPKLKETITEEQRHLDHPKKIYESVSHNCRYNKRINELLLEELQQLLGEKE